MCMKFIIIMMEDIQNLMMKDIQNLMMEDM